MTLSGSLNNLPNNLDWGAAIPFLTLLDHISDALMVVDRDWCILFVNKAAERFATRNRQELVGKTLFLEFPRLLNTPFEDQYRLALTERKSLEFTEVSPYSHHRFAVTVHPFSDGLAIYYRHADTQEEPTAAQTNALFESEIRFHTLFDANTIGIMFVQEEYIVDANHFLLELLGYSHAEVTDRNLRWTDLTPSAYVEKDQRAMSELLTTKRCTPYEKEYIRQDGSRVPVLVGAAIMETDPPLAAYFVIDLTIQKQAQDLARESRKTLKTSLPADSPKLFSHNVDVDRVNTEELLKIKVAEKKFEMAGDGNPNLVATLKKGCLSPENLMLKIGARVMFTKNNPKEGFVNGTLGVVEGFGGEDNYPIVKTKNGRKIVVEPMEWSVEENGKIKARISQIPLRLAWAITVHKSQGMSMDSAVMDLSDVFEYGQGYVALSRVRRLSGLHILGWNERAFKVHPDVLQKDEDFRIQSEKATEAFGQISANELQKMQNNFIVASGGKIRPAVRAHSENKIHKSKKINTKEQTLSLWKEGKNIADIAKERKFTIQTIFGHIEDLVNDGKIDRKEFSRIITPKLSKVMSEIQATFKKLDTDKLSPVFEKLGGKYSYDDIRIARIMLK